MQRGMMQTGCLTAPGKWHHFATNRAIGARKLHRKSQTGDLTGKGRIPRFQSGLFRFRLACHQAKLSFGRGVPMKHRGNVLTMIAFALFFAVMAASAQTYTNLFAYPGTDNNTSGITWPSVFSQGQDGNLYSTIQTNGTNNAGSVYKITPAGQYSLLYSFCAEAGHCLTTGAYPTGGVTLGFDGNLWG